MREGITVNAQVINEFFKHYLMILQESENFYIPLLIIFTSDNEGYNSGLQFRNYHLLNTQPLMKNMKLLIVDDEPGITSFLKEGLEEASYSVDIASDGKSGLDMALSNTYSLIILDWMIPVLSGIEVCNQIRKTGSMVPIIFLTAKKNLDDLLIGFEAGANDYIKKPFEFEELLVRINAQLKKSLKEENTLTVGKLTINTLSHQVFFDSKEIIFTPKEFSLLEYLVHNMDSVCTRNRILQEVWEIPPESDTSVVDVFITFIRRKLEKAGGRKIIQTIYGIGYVVREQDLL